MNKHKPHQRVETRRLYSHKPGEEVFTFNRHNCLWLSEILVSNSKLRGNRLSSQQKAALDSFQKRKVFDLGDSNPNYLYPNVLDAYFCFFDDLFFFGSLRDRCELHLRRFAGNRGGVGLSGRTEKKQKEFSLSRIFKGPEKEMFVIALYLGGESAECGRRDELLSYIGSLLHEMIHAFLNCWACRYDGCFNADNRVGKGHGPVWQDIAYALEHAARDPSFLNLPLGLRRDVQLASELHQTGGPAYAGDLARWHISEKALQHYFRIIHAIGGGPAIVKIVNGK